MAFRQEEAVKSAVDLVVRGTGFGPPVECRGQVTPMSTVTAFEAYGVEVSEPFLVIIGVDDAGLIPKAGTLMEWKGQKFFQVSGPQTFSAASLASHSSAVFQRYQYERGDT